MEGGFISQQDVNDKQPELQQAWDDAGLKGKNSYCDHYKLDDNGNVYDVVPLSDCAETVKGWLRDLEKDADTAFERMSEHRTREKGGEKGTMSGYYAKIYRNAVYNDTFSFDTNVFDIDEEIAEKLPENIEGYYAVMVDMHN